MTFNYGTRNLTGQQKAIINEREKNDKILKEGSKQNSISKFNTFEIAIFMKLGQESSGKYNGIETLKIYQEFCINKGSVWFSTDSLAKGMSEKKRLLFLEEIEKNNIVEIYFAVGKGIDKINDIVFKGEVIDIKSDKEGVCSPDMNYTPSEWRNNNNKIWIKVKNLKPFDKLCAEDFIVESSGNVLKDIINRSQYQFGYIKRKS